MAGKISMQSITLRVRVRPSGRRGETVAFSQTAAGMQVAARRNWRPTGRANSSASSARHAWLFSGWNCVANTLSRQMAAANGVG